MRTVAEKVSAPVLTALLVSCVAARPITPIRAEELAHLVLFIKEQPDGTVTHSWRRAEEVDLSEYRFLSSARGLGGRIVLAVGRKRDCDQENDDCIDKCMNRPLPRGFGHITSGARKRGGKAAYCREECRQAYLDCIEVQNQQPQEFTAIDPAIDWLKRNRRELLVGSVVIIAGVAFIVVTGGWGGLVLAPAVLLADPTTGEAPFMAEVSP